MNDADRAIAQIKEALDEPSEVAVPEDTVSNRRAVAEKPGEAINIMQRQQQEIDRLRAAVTALASLVQRDRVALYQAHRLPSGMVDDDEGKRGLAEYDAALRLADEAMGKDGME